MLDGAVILVAEDQPFIALELAFSVEDAGGNVVGPAASVRHALALIKEHLISAAILDFNLTDGDVTPVIAALTEANIPFIIQSGIGLMPELSARFPASIVYSKPNDPSELVSKIGVLIAAQRNLASG